jgi:hypothetical protein
MRNSKIIRKLRYWRFICSGALNEIKQVALLSDATLLLTIAFNEVLLIERQIVLLRRNFTDSFVHVVVDNSTDPEVRRSIKRICRTNKVLYAGVPKNPYSNTKSHAAAMHWAYFQLVKDSKFLRFGFLDHDIFPLAPYSLQSKMRQGIYGRVMHSYFSSGYHSSYSPEVPYWSLWAGFCFFDRELFYGRFPWSLNFFSKHFKDGNFLDTGGGLWDCLFSKMEYPGELASYQIRQISEEAGKEIQNQSFEILDDSWIHFVSLSNWRSITDLDSKKELFLKILTAHQELPGIPD